MLPLAMICTAYGENAVSHTICKRWYQKFRQEDFSLEGGAFWTLSKDSNGRIASTARYKLCAS